MEMTQEQREGIIVRVKKLAVYAIENLDKQDKYDKIDTITIMVSNILHSLKTPEPMPMTMEEKDI